MILTADKRNLSYNGLDKSCFPNTIWSDNSYCVKFTNIQIDRLGQHLVIITNSRIFYSQNDISRRLSRAKGHISRTTASVWLVQTLHFFQLFASGLSAFGCRCPNQIAIDKILQSSNFLLLLFIILGLRQELLLLLPNKTRVISHIAVQRMLGQVQCHSGYFIKKITVVTDDDESSAIVTQVVFQPSNRLYIQVVGRLIQYQ